MGDEAKSLEGAPITISAVLMSALKHITSNCGAQNMALQNDQCQSREVLAAGPEREPMRHLFVGGVEQQLPEGYGVVHEAHGQVQQRV